ncbi:hypothetical protein E5288_WYG001774 [Bos mutus]|uniref:Uncharacterized protein n=1 Tax=Bos mutus TaxID=72004 RepID=A0A6B0RWC4_9CETA|nr:hypothetical protein [Bos mutus]
MEALRASVQLEPSGSGDRGLRSGLLLGVWGDRSSLTPGIRSEGHHSAISAAMQSANDTRQGRLLLRLARERMCLVTQSVGDPPHTAHPPLTFSVHMLTAKA